MLNDSLKTKKLLFDAFDVVAFLLFSLGIILFVRFFLFTPFSVVGQSMAPTFDQGDFIIVDKVSSHLDTYERGDVVVFLPPDKDTAYIKRIIGLPGETVRFDNGAVTICATDGTCSLFQEPYLPVGRQSLTTCKKDEFVITGGYFVMGDNRDHSTDSRCCFGYGCYEGSSYAISPDRILGRVWVRLFPHARSDFSLLSE